MTQSCESLYATECALSVRHKPDFIRVWSTRPRHHYWLVDTTPIVDCSIGSPIPICRRVRARLFGARRRPLYGLVSINHETIFTTSVVQWSKLFQYVHPAHAWKGEWNVAPYVSIVHYTSICSNTASYFIFFHTCGYVPVAIVASSGAGWNRSMSLACSWDQQDSGSTLRLRFKSPNWAASVEYLMAWGFVAQKSETACNT